MLRAIGWIAAHRFLLADLRFHLLGRPQWTAKINLKLVPDTDLIETACENSRGTDHMVGK